ncbi:MAG: DUF1015 domain-containing protein [Lachnospiraceae bacterium]|nr:DUF1015 domain-containing protein [Lachnospiraceae bacterium]
MAKLLPFRAYRPAQTGNASENAGRLAALPYDVVNEEEARREVAREPLSFLAIDRPETAFPKGTDPYADEVYQMAAQILNDRICSGLYVQDDAPCYYLYEQTFRGRTQTGIVCAASVDDYVEGVIKKHENTRPEKELDRIRHISVCNAQTGPIFLASRTAPGLSERIREIINRQLPVYDFVSAGDVRNRVFVVNDPEDIDLIRNTFSGMDSIYIADGHHRCASAVKVALKRREEEREPDPGAEYNYFLAVVFPEEDLYIMDYNRVVLDWNGHTEDELLDCIGQYFDLSDAGTPDSHDPELVKGSFRLYLKEKQYDLKLRDGIRSEDPVAGLDVSVLQDLILEPFFGIKDPRTDPKIEFVGGIRGSAELVGKAREGAACAFKLAPVSMRELMSVADAGRLMPPKSTWFEPKLLSGLFIHRI